MNYKDEIYASYIETHTKSLYGVPDLGKTKANWPAWRVYFGYFFADLKKESAIADLGCGTGDFLYWLKDLGFKNLRGADLSVEQVKQAHTWGLGEVEQKSVEVFLLENKNSLDVLIARDLWEHFTKEEVWNLSKLAMGALKPNGFLILQTVNAMNPLWGRLRHGDFTHDSAFTEDSIRQLFLAAGFKQVEVYPQRPVAHGVFSFIRYIIWRILEIFMKLFLLIETGSSRGVFTQNLIVRASV
jgi:2-polyprenyl-3-methyl-5-hydroxy-6-metoxy-1,4-benzoquinol methylase